MDWFLSKIWEDPLPTTTKKEITEMADIDPDPWDILGRKKRSTDLNIFSQTIIHITKKKKKPDIIDLCNL